MSGPRQEERPVAVVCGSDTAIGAALVSRLGDESWAVVTVDSAGTPSHPAASERIQGEIDRDDVWSDLAARLNQRGTPPRVFVHALSDFAGPGRANARADLRANTEFSAIVRSAELGCARLLPLMQEGQGAVVLVASVLAAWDTRAGAEAYSASQAGLLALMRTSALRGGPNGTRVNAVCVGLVADPAAGADAVSQEERDRIPLGCAAHPDDIVDAIQFLVSRDARHISGSALVVDGGQSLQSWSNTPRSSRYPPPVPHDPRQAVSPARFDGRAVLITGAAGGLGSAAARRFAAEGAALALLDRDGDALEQVAAELSADGRAVVSLTADVTNEAAMASAIVRAEQHFGHLDVLFNNAGIGGQDSSIVDMPSATWDEMIAVNLRGIFLGCKYGVPALARGGGGSIVNMGSSTGRHDTITGGAAYMASKAAVEALTKSLALQVAPLGIRANTICPGIIETRLSFRQQERGDETRFFAEFASRIPLGRVGQPEDVAAAVAFLASDRAKHITGAALLIDGGQTLRRWISAPDLASSWL
jgi:NAD(P)-dependent dehydrogenase (short-subunit alcohol dehydrogenase family)